ncbi:VOC family protein [Afifella sp. JA880]|uniref:VOC family protein n=1 Tax=Afifella sp. JA880 TaxID=2975280 RepID=UPI0021BA60CA|nr:VOC family protein [Afifella sp. JA880]MCT8265786.1 VOC family protein [Afifella sp. JA880]
MEQRLSVVTLGVSDLSRARQFYEDGLGWQRANAHEEVVFYDLNGFVLALYPRTSLAADAKVDPDGSGFSGITLAFNARSREEVDVVLKEAEAAGAEVVKTAEEVFWGGYSGYFADPDGHLWEVAHNPFWTIDADGRVLLGE